MFCACVCVCVCVFVCICVRVEVCVTQSDTKSTKPCTSTSFYNAPCFGLSVSYTPSQRVLTPYPVLQLSSISSWLSTPQPQLRLETDSG